MAVTYTANAADPLAPQDDAPATYAEEFVPGPDAGLSFYTRVYLPTGSGTPKGCIVFVHGFQEHIGRYDHVFRRIQSSAHEFAVVAYDQRGWGRTALTFPEGKVKTGLFFGQYGGTSRPHQLADAEFFVKWAEGKMKETFPNAARVPTFVWGQSMGGGIALSFGTAKHPGPPSTDTLASLSGIVASSPLIQQATPAAKALRLVGAAFAKFVPSWPFPVEVIASDLSRDPRIEVAVKADPLIKAYGTFGGINDMLAAGDYLNARGYNDWPQKLPLLMVHGTADKVCSYPASRAFYDQVTADDKHYIAIEGAYHETYNEPEIWEKCVDDIVSWMKDRTAPSAEAAKL